MSSGHISPPQQDGQYRLRKPQTDLPDHSNSHTPSRGTGPPMVPAQRLTELNDRILELKLKLKEANGMADAERREKQRLLEQNTELNGELAEVRKALKEMQMLFFKNVQNATEQMTRAQDQRSTQMNDIMRENKELDQKVRDLTMRLRSAEYQSSQPHALEDRCQRLKQALDNSEMMLESSRREVTNLKEEVRDLQSLVSDLRKSKKRADEMDENIQAQMFATQQKASVVDGLREQLQVSQDVINRQREDLKLLKQEKTDTLSLIARKDETILELRETMFKEKELKLQAQSEKRIVEAELQIVIKTSAEQPRNGIRTADALIEDEKFKRELFVNEVERERLREENGRLRTEKAAFEAVAAKKDELLEQFRLDLFEEKQNNLKLKNEKRIVEIENENLRLRKDNDYSAYNHSPERLDQLFAKVTLMETMMSSPMYNMQAGMNSSPIYRGSGPISSVPQLAMSATQPQPAMSNTQLLQHGAMMPTRPTATAPPSESFINGPSPIKANRPVQYAPSPSQPVSAANIDSRLVQLSPSPQLSTQGTASHRSSADYTPKVAEPSIAAEKPAVINATVTTVIQPALKPQSVKPRNEPSSESSVASLVAVESKSPVTVGASASVVEDNMKDGRGIHSSDSESRPPSNRSHSSNSRGKHGLENSKSSNYRSSREASKSREAEKEKEREKDKDKDKEKEEEKAAEKEKEKDRDRDRNRDRDKENDKEKEKYKVKHKESDLDTEDEKEKESIKNRARTRKDEKDDSDIHPGPDDNQKHPEKKPTEKKVEIDTSAAVKSESETSPISPRADASSPSADISKVKSLLKAKSSKRLLEANPALNIGDITPAAIESANLQKLEEYLERANKAAETALQSKEQIKKEVSSWTENYKIQHGCHPKPEDRPADLKTKYREINQDVTTTSALVDSIKLALSKVA